MTISPYAGGARVGRVSTITRSPIRIVGSIAPEGMEKLRHPRGITTPTATSRSSTTTAVNHVERNHGGRANRMVPRVRRTASAAAPRANNTKAAISAKETAMVVGSGRNWESPSSATVAAMVTPSSNTPSRQDRAWTWPSPGMTNESNPLQIARPQPLGDPLLCTAPLLFCAAPHCGQRAASPGTDPPQARQGAVPTFMSQPEFQSRPGFQSWSRSISPGPTHRPPPAIDPGLAAHPRPGRRSRPTRSMDWPHQPGPANLERPLPEFPPGIFGIHREEDDFRAADQVLSRNEPDVVHEAAVLRIIPVVTHREQMVGRHHVFGRIVCFALICPLQDVVCYPAGQRLLILAIQLADAALVGLERPHGLAWHQVAVDVELALPDLDTVPRQPDDPLDVVDAGIARVFEHRDVATVRQAAEDPPGEQVERERQREVRVAVAVFRHEQVVADQQRRDHAAGGDVERLVGEGPDADRDQSGIDDCLEILDPYVGLALGLADRHEHFQKMRADQAHAASGCQAGGENVTPMRPRSDRRAAPPR